MSPTRAPLALSTALLAGLLLSACGGQNAASPAASTSAPVAETAAAPSPTAIPPTPVPTDTPAPTATPLPALHSPLTGLAVGSEADITRRPLVVKIGNSGD